MRSSNYVLIQKNKFLSEDIHMCKYHPVRARTYILFIKLSDVDQNWQLNFCIVHQTNRIPPGIVQIITRIVFLVDEEREEDSCSRYSDAYFLFPRLQQVGRLLVAIELRIPRINDEGVVAAGFEKLTHAKKSRHRERKFAVASSSRSYFRVEIGASYLYEIVTRQMRGRRRLIKILFEIHVRSNLLNSHIQEYFYRLYRACVVDVEDFEKLLKSVQHFESLILEDSTYKIKPFYCWYLLTCASVSA